MFVQSRTEYELYATSWGELDWLAFVDDSDPLLYNSYHLC
jgi:hypothetical protein